MNVIISKERNFIVFDIDNTIGFALYIHEIEDKVIENIIRFKYSSSNVEAIFANYMLDKDNAKYVKEFENLQIWRKKAKYIGNKIITFIHDNDLFHNPNNMFNITIDCELDYKDSIN